MEELIAFEHRIQIYSKKFDAVENRIKELINIEINLRNNNSILENLGEKIGELETKISIIKKKFHDSPTASQNAIEPKREDSALLQKEDIPYGIDYFDFENTFRGSRTKIKSIQEQYVSYFKGCSQVLDLGSGRGEFLELLKEYGIGAVGVEIYEEFVEFCRNRDLKVIQQDVLG